ncbi:ABC transporter permease [Microbacterium sp. NIBRBAC000506063]|uniref:ABC transporter permease n=1 Tax=Microbacterium sp. NIBRBAC000506063 TaxID=2734618 RepID=UPI001BB6D4F5|nr:ABC transporter permease [Microbacterium sp. NIBRBAC000506063]QTV79372.1 ABC transporter permease [Microbacterium sp. NIBRBAC000506063]
MSTTTKPSAPELSPELSAAAPIAWKAPILYAVSAVIVLVFFGVMGSTTPARFRWTDATAAITLEPTMLTPRTVGFVCGALLAVIAAAALWRAVERKSFSPWFGVLAGVLFLLSLLAWTGAGGTVQVVYLLNGTIALSTAVIFGALAGVIGERVGVVNIAIEGQLLAGAFVAAVLGSITGNLWVGLFGAMIGGALVSLVLAVFSIKYIVNQIIVGVVLNVLVIGLTNFFYSSVLNTNASAFNNPGFFRKITIPWLSEIPVLGPVLFDQNIITYTMFVLVFLVWLVLFKSRLGLRIRAMGEHPLAADTVGLNVNRTRFWTVSIAGLIAGLGGAALTIGSVGAFGREMSAGQGFIALAMVILGRWHPLYAAMAALLYGFSGAFRIWAGGVPVGSEIPSDLIQMVPYVVTLVAVVLFVGRAIPPAAVGKPYIKE